MSRAIENFGWSNIAATTAAFTINTGGKYALTGHATWGGGNIQLTRQANDGSTFVNVGSSLTADGLTTMDLPRGVYKLAITTATAVYADLSRIPTE
jgi:hypothetical protein